MFIVLPGASHLDKLSHRMWRSELDRVRVPSQLHSMKPTIRTFTASAARTSPSLLMLVLLLSGAVNACSTSADTTDDAATAADDVDDSAEDVDEVDTNDDSANLDDEERSDDDVGTDDDPDDDSGTSTDDDRDDPDVDTAADDDRDDADEASTNDDSTDSDDSPNSDDAPNANEPRPPDPSGIDVGVSDANGQTGSAGGSECSADAECIEIAEAMLQELTEPGSVGATFDQADCIMAGLASGPSGIVCECTNEGGGSLTVGLECARRGRHGECIYPAEEFPGCELGVAESCTDVCSDLQSRLEAAAAQTYETELRTAYCDGTSCVAVSRVDDTCHVSRDFVTAYDCALSDEEILAERAEQQALDEPPPCDSPEAASSDTCYETTAPNEEYHPRDPDEWQGMLVDISSPLYCEGFCGMALACIEEQCLPCESDAQCMEGEGCVLDHCMPLDNIECRGRADCGDDLCVLSGYTGGTARANEDMRAYCLSPSGGSSM